MQPTHNKLSEAIADADTAVLFTERSRGVDHRLWFVESHVAPK
jgi:DNA-binding ferritin-like protein